MTKNYVAIIPARGGSKRFFRKNLALFNGKPLIAHTIEAARKSLRLERVIVSTEDPEIAAVAIKYNAEVPFLRPLELAQDHSTTLQVINHVLECLETESRNIDAVVLLQPTSPLRTNVHIDEAIDLFEKSSADTVVAVCLAQEHPFYAWNLLDGKLTPYFSHQHQIMDRNELPPAFFVNGSIYVISATVLQSGAIYGGKSIPYQMDRSHSVDIDTPLDLLWAEFILSHNRD
ncbi:MAG TPA: acylneuraminate cytidylyltransferase family protein [Bacillota bacterium]|nr:acylneuraminate cytidylyltransferase family protein [Bacillota bacterium]